MAANVCTNHLLYLQYVWHHEHHITDSITVYRRRCAFQYINIRHMYLHIFTYVSKISNCRYNINICKPNSVEMVPTVFSVHIYIGATEIVTAAIQCYSKSETARQKSETKTYCSFYEWPIRAHEPRWMANIVHHIGGEHQVIPHRPSHR